MDYSYIPQLYQQGLESGLNKQFQLATTAQPVSQFLQSLRAGQADQLAQQQADTMEEYRQAQAQKMQDQFDYNKGRDTLNDERYRDLALQRSADRQSQQANDAQAARERRAKDIYSLIQSGPNDDPNLVATMIKSLGGDPADYATRAPNAPESAPNPFKTIPASGSPGGPDENTPPDGPSGPEGMAVPPGMETSAQAEAPTKPKVMLSFKPGSGWMALIAKQDDANAARNAQDTLRRDLADQASKDRFALAAMIHGANSSGAPQSYDQAPPATQKLVDAIGHYQAVPEKVVGRGKDRAALMALVYEKYPDYQEAQAAENRAFLLDLAKSGPATAGGRVDSANRLIEHAHDFSNVIEGSSAKQTGWLGKLENAANYPANMMRADVGPKNFDAWKETLLSETEKLISGGVPYAQNMKRRIETMSYTDPIDVKRGVLNDYLNMGLAQTHALEEKRKNILRDWDPGTSLISPENEQRLKALDKLRGVTTERKPASSMGYGPDRNPMGLAPDAGGKEPVKRQYNPATGKTRLVYADGTTKIVGGAE